MNYFLNTPLQVPLPLPALSPFITANNHFNSPFISPYMGGQDNRYTLNSFEDKNDQFSNFHLDQPIQPQVKQESESSEQEEQPLPAPEPKIQKQQIQVKIKTPVQDSDEDSFVSEVDCQISIKIKQSLKQCRKMINILVKLLDKSDQKISIQKQKCVQNDKVLGQIFDILLRKFKKLKKTKEEMTKYCMRKAFKYLADKYKKDLDGKETSQFLSQYFKQVQSQGFCIPFKKNSEEKTMNSNFLKKVFMSKTFLNDYKMFLKTFGKLVQDDNNKKIKYLASTIRSYYNLGSIKKLQSVKRLPWTQGILDKTIDLAQKLMIHSPEYESMRDFDQKVTKKSIKQKLSLVRSPSMRRKSTVSLADTIASPVNTFNAIDK